MPSSPALESPVAQATEAHRPCILLAEDDPAMRALIASMLEQEGYEVIEARDGHEVLARLEAVRSQSPLSNPPALIVSDIRMPAYSGLDLLAILRCAACPVPVILITAFGDEETHAEARELGATAILDKPFDLDDLRALVVRAAPIR
jgi:CheY-like chemotaxis protein